MIHPISNTENSLVFLQPHESRPWTSAVWTSQSQLITLRCIISRHVLGEIGTYHWHLAEGFFREESICWAGNKTEPEEWGGNSKMVFFFFSFLTESTAFDLKSSWHKEISWKTWMITPKSMLYRCFGSPTSQLLQQVFGGGYWLLLFCSFNSVSKSCY